MLSRRLIQKLEALNDDALAHFEQQADVLLTMPDRCRNPQMALHLVKAVRTPADVHRLIVASQTATASAQTETFHESGRLVALQMRRPLDAIAPTPAKITHPPQRRVKW